MARFGDESPCRWAAAYSDPLPADKHLADLSAKEQVARGKELLGMLKKPAVSFCDVEERAAPTPVSLQRVLSAPVRGHRSDSLSRHTHSEGTVTVKRTFIEIVPSCRTPSRSRIFSDSAVVRGSRSQDQLWEKVALCVPSDLSEASTDDDDETGDSSEESDSQTTPPDAKGPSTSPAPAGEYALEAVPVTPELRTSLDEPVGAPLDLCLYSSVKAPSSSSQTHSMNAACWPEQQHQPHFHPHAVSYMTQEQLHQYSAAALAGSGFEQQQQQWYTQAPPGNWSYQSNDAWHWAPMSSSSVPRQDPGRVQQKEMRTFLQSVLHGRKPQTGRREDSSAKGPMQDCYHAVTVGNTADNQAQDEIRTTAMLRNIPKNYSRDMFRELVDAEGFRDEYDFIYLPVDFGSQAGLGYAFVNFTTPEAALRAFNHFDGFANWIEPSDKVCAVVWGIPHQGLLAHVERYRNSPVMHESIPDTWKPAIYSAGRRVPFPPTTKPIAAPKVRQVRSKHASPSH